MYISPNFPSKAAAKRAIAAGTTVEVFQNSEFGREPPENGKVTVEGPHSPRPHTWYGQAVIKDGKVVKIT